jgi:glycosyltransferase involved in cell wall biosynthesis
LKILFLAKYYPPTEGGIERYSHMLCTSLVQRGIEVEVIAAAGAGEAVGDGIVDGVKVRRLQAQLNVSSAPITLALPGLLRRLKPKYDLLHFNFPYPWTDLIYLAVGRSHKTILTYHSDIFRKSNTLSGRLLKLYQPCLRLVLQKMPAIVASSPNLVRNSPFLRPNSDRCRVVPMPVDTDLLQPPEASAVEEVQSRYGKYVLFVGRIVHYKGLDFLLQACARMDGVPLVIVGQGPLEAEYKALAKALDIEDRVFFLGQVSDAQRLALCYGCQCFVLPSISHAEGFGIAQAEAMACGKPVVSTELGTGTSYVNLDGVTGFVVPPENPEALADKIALLVRDSELAVSMGEKGRERVYREFTREIVVDKTIALYEDVLAGKSIAE